MKIKIIAISKNKFAYISEGEADYLQRLQKYCQVEVLNLKEEPIKSQPVDDILAKEGERILKSFDQDYFKIALHVMGKELTSHEFSQKLEEIRDFKGGKICFIIGGPLGLDQRVLAKADLALSFSKMTFTHQLIRLLLLEQIYRGFEILAGTEYHK